ncbi:hypothetical protein [Rhodoligotrophos defluvii]|uniref:hypothetical protein n=1 Tax=Rhodoligotrophos defluvii TaxID=2561934 RepID=UPI0010C9D4F6|nr:hypothetical protein [Rhodoligotrophos defluvii]
MDLGLGLGLRSDFFGVPGVIAAYDPAAQDFFDRLESQLSPDQRSAVNDFIVGGKASGWWALADAIWIAKSIFATSTETVLQNMRQDAYNATRQGTLTLDDTGSTGDGTTGYWNSGFNPATAGGNFSQDSSSLGVYSASDVANANYVELGNTHNSIGARNGNNKVGARSSASTTDQSVAGSPGTGVISTNRADSTGFAVYIDGAQLATFTRASISPASLNLYLGARNNKGVAGNFSARTLRAWWVGAALSEPQITSRDAAFAALWAGLA